VWLLACLIVGAGAVLAPATPAFAHGGDTSGGSAYLTRVTGISAPEKGLTVRTVEAGARLELTNRTGHPVEILGYSGEPYLDVRPDGTWQNVNSPAAYINETASGDNPVPATADPTAPPTWRKISAATSVRWHDQRTHWLGPGPPPQATADPTRAHRLRDWAVPLREQVTTFEIRGTLDWEPAPRAWLWWSGAALAGLALTALLIGWPRSVTPVALIGGLCPILYGVSRIVDGAAAPVVLIVSGLLAIAAAYRHPPFYLALAGAALTLFGAYPETYAFGTAVLPAAGPSWLPRVAVAAALAAGAAMTLAGIQRLRAALPRTLPVPRPPEPAT
jgi:hypothetical protein